MLEKNKVYLGDCLELMKDIADKSIDMILCDLPYGTTACKWDVIIPFDKLWEQYHRIIKDNGAIVLTASQPFTSLLVCSNLQMFKYNIIWDKKKPSSVLHAKIQPLRKHEDILIFAKNKTTYNPQMEEAKQRSFKDTKYNNGEAFGGVDKIRSFDNKGLKYPKSIIEISNANQIGKVHPTQKPVALFEYLIKTYTNEDDLVLDNCAGSGTTAIACLNTNRNCILIEKEEKYYNVIQDRIKNYIKKEG